MTRIPYAEDAALAAHADTFALVEAHMGFVPNSLRVMARRPDILNAFLSLSLAVMGPSTATPQSLKQLVAHAASLAAGCLYCQAHTAHTGERVGVAAEKLARAWDYERSPQFTDAERAAMRYAQNAASVPNGVSEADMTALRAHFNDDEITEILAVVGLFGFLNRWNDSLATDLEEAPLSFGAAHLASGGWSGGKHAAGAATPADQKSADLGA